MFTLSSSNRFHLYSEATDMRKSFNGLSGIIENELEGNPINGDVFMFINGLSIENIKRRKRYLPTSKSG